MMNSFYTLLLITCVTCVMIMHVVAETGDSSAINLDVSRNSNPGAQSRFLVINCSVDLDRAGLKTVASLTVFGSNSYGAEGEFDQLASVDMWSNSPKLAHELEKSHVTVTGETGPGLSSSLILSWNTPISVYCHSYTCKADGIDKEGRARSLSTAVKTEVVSGECCQNIDHITTQFHALSATVLASTNTTSDLSEQIEFLNDKIEVLEEKLDSVKFSSTVQSTLLAIDLTNFDVSDVYKGRLYLASKQEAVFDIQSANAACLSVGGYLLEIDDDDETNFTLAFAKRIGGSDHFALGGNDIKEEGKFIYFNSKKPVPEDITWKIREPNNSGGKEDCMEIWLLHNGINDISCELKTKFMCEVPLRFY